MDYTLPREVTVTERVVNIAELEELIRSALLKVSVIQREIKEESPSMEKIEGLCAEAVDRLEKADSFEFCVERRRTRYATD